MPIKLQGPCGVPTHDARRAQLLRWLVETFATVDFELSSVSSDASSRRYFRVQLPGRSLIAMDAPPAQEKLDQFLRVADMLASIGLSVPHIHQYDAHAGFLLMSDLGTRTYYDELRGGGSAACLYRDALDALVHLQTRGQTHALQLPPYTAVLLQREAALFYDWFCVRHLQLSLSAADLQSLHAASAWLAQQALAQPCVFVHRDYHSRNLMVGRQAFPATPGILDFQDALQGPLTYDLVSLLRDCYIDWPQAAVQGWLEYYHRALQASPASPPYDLQQLSRWFDLMGVQRHLKAIGIFARLKYRDGKCSYLEHVPRTLGYLCAVAAQYAELRFLADLIEGRVLPAWLAAG